MDTIVSNVLLFENYLTTDSLYTLDENDKIGLIEFILDSTNFSHGECGTFALNAGFVFIENDSIKGTIELSCGYYQWHFNPYSPNTMDGSLSRNGFKK